MERSMIDWVEDIEKRFNYHPPRNDETKQAHEVMRETMKRAAMVAVQYVPEGRELSLVLTKLEEAMMWGNAGIARSHD